MIEYLKNIVDLSEYVGTDAFCGVRVNPLKLTKEKFEKHAFVDLSPCDFFKYGYYVKGDISGNHPLHIGGGCYIQEPSAMSAVTALDIQEDDIVLDACAAPGSKATAIAPMCKILVANEFSKSRVQALIGNIERLGISNALVLNSDTDALACAFEGYFDKVLVDSPCSGEGMFRKHPSVLENWTPQLVDMCAKRSAQVLDNAAKTLKAGGRLVYSTCTYNLEENEKVILSFLQNHPDFEIVDTGLEFGKSGFLGLTKARRIFIEDGGEGHFVCALKRTGSVFTKKVKAFKLKNNFNFLEKIVDIPPIFLGEQNNFGVLDFQGCKYAVPDIMPNPQGVRIMRAGVKLGTEQKNVFKPEHHLFMAANPQCILNKIEVDKDGFDKFMRGDILQCNSEMKGFCAIMFYGLVIGFGKASGGVCKNHLPQGLRI